MCIFVLKIKLFLIDICETAINMFVSTSRPIVFFRNPTAVTLPIVIFSHIKYGTDHALFIIASIGSQYEFWLTFDMQVIEYLHPAPRFFFLYNLSSNSHKSHGFLFFIFYFYFSPRKHIFWSKS